jgi:hypothetical protein
MLPDEVHELDLAAIQPHLLQTCLGSWSLPQDDSFPMRTASRRFGNTALRRLGRRGDCAIRKRP